MADSKDTPVIIVEEVGRTIRRPVDAAARARYIDELRKTGSRHAAAAVARPHLRSRKSAFSIFQDHMDQHPGFKAQVLDVEAELAGEAEVEIRRRAFDGVVTYEKRDEQGNVLEQKIHHDNKLLLAYARRVAGKNEKGAWADRKELLVSNETNQNVTADVDKVLEGLSEDALKQLIGSIKAARQLSPGDVDDADLVAEPAVDPIADNS